MVIRLKKLLCILLGVLFVVLGVVFLLYALFEMEQGATLLPLRFLSTLRI